MKTKLLTSIFFFSLTACAGRMPDAPPAESDADELAADGKADSAKKPVYEDVYDFTNEGASSVSFDDWWGLSRTLAHDFDNVCGDTFCEGDYTNLQSLSLRCSVKIKTGVLKACTWTFAGSYESVTASTGYVHVYPKVFQCKLPVDGIALDAFVQALTVPATNDYDLAIRRPLPGSESSIYDSLVDCL